MHYAVPPKTLVSANLNSSFKLTLQYLLYRLQGDNKCNKIPDTAKFI